MSFRSKVAKNSPLLNQLLSVVQSIATQQTSQFRILDISLQLRVQWAKMNSAIYGHKNSHDPWVLISSNCMAIGNICIG